jgi:hypothetical protein
MSTNNYYLSILGIEEIFGSIITSLGINDIESLYVTCHALYKLKKNPITLFAMFYQYLQILRIHPRDEMTINSYLGKG